MLIFLSYSGENRHLAGELKECFEEYEGITCFVAHDDIKSGTVWEEEILQSLKAADYFMPLQTEELCNSHWCQQEAGIAVERGIPILPLKPDEGGVDPIGFYKRYQAAKIVVGEVRESVKRLLIQQGIVEADSVAEEIDVRLLLFENSDSFSEAESNISDLLKFEERLTRAQIKRIAQAAANNGQIRSSFGARRHLRRFFSRHAGSIPRDVVEQYLD